MSWLSFLLQRWHTARRNSVEEDPLVAASGIGKHLWGKQDAVEYVAELRKGWVDHNHE